MKFYINILTHEIHSSLCSLADPIKYLNIINLGNYPSSKFAIQIAIKKGYSNAKSCIYCCNKNYPNV